MSHSYREYVCSESGSLQLLSAVKEAVDSCHGVAYECGWWTDTKTGEPLKKNVGEVLCLIHSEVSEAMEGHRKNLMDDHLPHRPMIEVELADAFIRICDAAKGLGLDLPGAVAEKLPYNCNRSDHKPEVRANGGKRY